MTLISVAMAATSLLAPGDNTPGKKEMLSSFELIKEIKVK